MRSIDILDLGPRSADLVSEIRRCSSELVLTLGGEPIAILRPVTDANRERLIGSGAFIRAPYSADSESSLDELAKFVAAAWRSPRTGVEEVDAQRRG